MIWKLLLHRSKSASEPWERKHCHFQSLVSGTIKKPSSIKWNIKKLKCRKTLTVHDLNPCWQPIYCSKPDQTLLCASLRWTCWLESWCLTSSCLETASQTSLKSSERGKLTSYTRTKDINAPPHDSHALLTHPSMQLSVESGYKFATFCKIYLLSDTNSRRQDVYGNKLKFRRGSRNTHLLVHLCLQ